MEERTLLIIAVITIIIGLPLLFFAANTELQEKKASITGKVSKVIHKEKLTIAHITTDVPVVYFDNVNVKQGEEIIVEGKLQEYKGKIEFIVD